MTKPGRRALAKQALHSSIEAFLDMLTAERGAAENTRLAYSRDLADLQTWLGDRKVAIDSADQKTLSQYLLELGRRAGRGVAVRTVARRLSALRQFYRFLLSENRRADDPTAGLENPRQGRILPRILSEDDVGRLIQAAHKGQGPDTKRLAALMEILYATGLRVSELVGLPL